MNKAARLCGVCRLSYRRADGIRGRANDHAGGEQMDCADCPFIVQKSLERVPGVAKVAVSFKDKTAIVTYDDSKANVTGLTAATTNAGYPSAPKS